MTRYEHNQFVGTAIRIDGEVWVGNVIERCRVEIDRPPAEFDGNVIRGSGINFVGEMDRAMRFIANLAAGDPQLKIQLRDALGLGDPNEGSDPPVSH